MNQVNIKPVMLQWARERAGFDVADLLKRFPRIEQWEQEEAQPTLKQLEKFAKATFVPIGYLFLPEPPVESVPIPDFRTFSGDAVARPSPNLLDTLYLCQQRQAWYREYARGTRSDRLAFVGSADLGTPVEEVAGELRHLLGFDLEERKNLPTWSEALRRFIAQADAMGVLAMCSGVVLNNNRRKLDPREFRGFALTDELAPLVFINGADSKAAQMFTLAHELAHLWLGQSALSNIDMAVLPTHKVERWCNQVAAELLVPIAALQEEFQASAVIGSEINRLARQFKVSTLVVLRRLFDAGLIQQQLFYQAYEEELERIHALPKSSGGNFYLTQSARVSKRFARALFESTLEGQTLYRDAFRMLGVSKVDTFNELGRSLGFGL
ncbi:MAG: ImmA/IrrE family metallo-endopeptidase [Gammaproteobacteria bacterium]|nr:ImmA/IrrE family metallo-endopeptidase [Gammaproteobacteria bacterium]